MERELGGTARAIGRTPAFGGFVIHHYAAHRRWLGADQGPMQGGHPVPTMRSLDACIWRARGAHPTGKGF
jgi:hypothetical protein